MKKENCNLLLRDGVSLLDERRDDFIERACDRIERFDGSNENLDITLGRQNAINYKVKIMYKADNIQLIRVEKVGEDLLSTYQEALSVLERKLKKQYDFLKNNKKHGDSVREAFISYHESEYDEELIEDLEFGEFLAGVATVKDVVVKEIPLSLAMLEFDMLGFGFYVFRNEETGLLEVLYERHDERPGRIVIKE